MRPRKHLATLYGVSALAVLLAAGAPAAPASPTAAPVQPAPTTAPAKSAAKPAAETKAAPAAKAAAKPAAKAAASAELDKIIEGAKKETVLKGQWSGSSFGGSAGLNEFVAGMNKQYGVNIQAQFTPGRNMQGMLELLAQESAANQPASSDVYLGNAPAMVDAIKAAALAPINWRAILPRDLPAEQGFDPVAPDGIGVAFASTLVGIMYNSDLVKGNDVPQKLNDVLDPKWKGKIASTPYAAGMRELATPDMLGPEVVEDFTRKLSQQIGGLIRCGEGERLTSGEFLMLVMTCGGNDVVVAKRSGAPLEHTVVDEGTIAHMRYAGVPKNSASPNAATLLIAYLHTPEGQQLLWKHDGMDLHLYPEANTRKDVERVRAAGGKFAVNSPQWLTSFKNFSFPENQKKLEQILQEGSGG